MKGKRNGGEGQTEPENELNEINGIQNFKSPKKVLSLSPYLKVSRPPARESDEDPWIAPQLKNKIDDGEDQTQRQPYSMKIIETQYFKGKTKSYRGAEWRIVA